LPFSKFPTRSRPPSGSRCALTKERHSEFFSLSLQSDPTDIFSPISPTEICFRMRNKMIIPPSFQPFPLFYWGIRFLSFPPVTELYVLSIALFRAPDCSFDKTSCRSLFIPPSWLPISDVASSPTCFLNNFFCVPAILSISGL